MLRAKETVEARKAAMVALFVKHGAQLDSFDPWDGELRTPLSFAADSCSLEVSKALLDHGASVDYASPEAESALFASAWRGDDIKKVELLLELGAAIHWARGDG